MADLYDPAPSLLAGLSLLGFYFLRATGHMGNVAVCLDDAQRRSASIPSIQAQMLGSAVCGRLALDHDGVQDGIQLRDVITIRSGHDERQGDATAVDQQVTFAPIFFPDQSGWARLAVAPVVP